MVSQKPKYCKNFERNSHWRKLSMIMVWERYCNALTPKPELFLFSLFIFSFISQLILQLILQQQVNWCTIDPFSLKFCTCKPTLLPSTFKNMEFEDLINPTCVIVHACNKMLCMPSGILWDTCFICKPNLPNFPKQWQWIGIWNRFLFYFIIIRSS